jgi:hypothetical protein
LVNWLWKTLKYKIPVKRQITSNTQLLLPVCVFFSLKTDFSKRVIF